MKKYLVIFGLITVFGCGNNITTVYNNEKPYEANQSNYPMMQQLNATGSDTSVVFFTSGFNNDTILLTSGSETLFNEVFTTSSTVGLAGARVISNEKKVKFTISSIQKEIKLDLEKLKRYKYVYVSKENKNLVIEYSNTFKKFM